jgi:hypothetical protein
MENIQNCDIYTKLWVYIYILFEKCNKIVSSDIVQQFLDNHELETWNGSLKFYQTWFLREAANSESYEFVLATPVSGHHLNRLCFLEFYGSKRLGYRVWNMIGVGF